MAYTEDNTEATEKSIKDFLRSKSNSSTVFLFTAIPLIIKCKFEHNMKLSLIYEYLSENGLNCKRSYFYQWIKKNIDFDSPPEKNKVIIESNKPINDQRPEEIIAASMKPIKPEVKSNKEKIAEIRNNIDKSFGKSAEELIQEVKFNQKSI